MPTQKACRLFDLSRRTYYNSQKRQGTRFRHKQRDDALGHYIVVIFEKSRKTYGAMRVQAELQSQGWVVSVSRVARKMRELGLQARRGRKKKIVTTVRHPQHKAAPRLFKTQDKSNLPVAPNQVWVGDATYIKTTSGTFYLFVVLDVFDRRLAGWCLSRDLFTKGAVKALDMSFQRSGPLERVIFHSDRGVQYTSEEFKRALSCRGGVSSMSRKGNCYDNVKRVKKWHTSAPD